MLSTRLRRFKLIKRQGIIPAIRISGAGVASLSEADLRKSIKFQRLVRRHNPRQ